MKAKTVKQAVKRGAYGVVVGMSGPHEDRIGFYDDDGEGGVAIVYFDGAPLITPYVQVKRSSLRAATADETEAWQQTSGNAPRLAKTMGTLPKKPRGTTH